VEGQVRKSADTSVKTGLNTLFALIILAGKIDEIVAV
jgi:hypothetical protein